MSKKSTSLYEFIKLLSPVEIRAVRHFSTRKSGDTKHMKLFDLLLGMENFDEGLIRKKFKGDPILNNLSRGFNYLYDFILKSLSAYYREPNADLDDLLRQVTIVKNKGKFEKALELIQKAKSIAAEREKMTEWLTLLKDERRIILSLPDMDFIDFELEKVRLETTNVKEMLFNLLAFEELEDNLILVSRMQTNRTHEWRSAEDLMSHPLLQEDAMVKSRRARLKYLRGRAEIEKQKNELGKFLPYALEIIDLLESTPFLLSENRNRYFEALTITFFSYMELGISEKAKGYYHKLIECEPQNTLEKVYLFETLSKVQLAWADYCGDPAPGFLACETLKEHYNLIFSNLKIEETYTLKWLAVRFNLEQKDLKSANYWIQDVLSMKRTKVRMNMQVWVRLMHLMLLFEREDWEGLVSHSRNYRRFVNEHYEKVTQIETELLRFFGRVPGLFSRNQVSEGLHEVYERTLQLSEQPHENVSLAYFNVLKWIENRIEVRGEKVRVG